MKKFTTRIEAIRVSDGELTKYAGPEVEAPTMKEAQEICEQTGLGYCRVIGELVMEVNENEINL